MTKKHFSVLTNELIKALNIKKDGIYVDCTLGLGGHTKQLSKLAINGQIISIDQDLEAVNYSKLNLKTFKNITYVHSNFINLEQILTNLSFFKVDGIIFDLGTSYYQLMDKERGFTYSKDSILDMRMDQTQTLNAQIVLNTYSQQELEKIFKEYGEEKQYRQLSKKIIDYRKNQKIVYSNQLNEIINFVKGFIKEKNPLKQIYQALRIEVNNEFENLKSALSQALKFLKIGAKLAVITFHSLEDKIVKDFFWHAKQEYVDTPKQKIFKFKTHKTIYPSELEISENNPSRSAKLRVITKYYE